ncbi:transcription factor MUTE-like [Silene latifolia]|uniref:transcription factor MUTE-like n=1 Tax=Silene latifolia TaxID=37657 RepID=UPI003D780579
MSESMASFFEGQEFGDPSFSKIPASPEDLFSIFDALEGLQEGEETSRRAFFFQELSETELDALEGEGDGDGDEQPKSKKAKIVNVEDEEIRVVGEEGEGSKMSHIAVERNRRKQMNEHLSVLRSLMPCFYVKRGDQASIIGGVVEYINELQQVLQSLEAKKQRKVYSEVLSPRLISSSPRPSPQVLSPRSKPPLSPRVTLPISPRTPQPSSPYTNNRHRTTYLTPTITTTNNIDLSPSSSSTSSMNDLVANLKSPVAEVEVKFSGPNLILKTVSPKIPGQVVKIVSTLEDLSLEILNISITTMEDTMLNSFTIKIGIECQLSVEELAHLIQQTFCSTPLIS